MFYAARRSGWKFAVIAMFIASFLSIAMATPASAHTYRHMNINGFRILGPFTWYTAIGGGSTDAIEGAAANALQNTTFTFTSNGGIQVTDQTGTYQALVGQDQNHAGGITIQYGTETLTQGEYFYGEFHDGVVTTAIYQWAGSGGNYVDGAGYGGANSDTVKFDSPLTTF